MDAMVNNWSRFALQRLYPPRCTLCGEPLREEGFCRGCFDDLPHNRNPCERCAQPLPPRLPAGSLCGECQKKPPPFHQCLAPFAYAFPLSPLITGLKFHRQLRLGPILGGLLADYLETRIEEPPEWLLPVPLHLRRLKKRGYNQALEIARVPARRLGIPLALDLCRRTRATTAQSDLDQKARHRNVRGAFTLDGGIEARHVAILDDVVTTGSTVAELTKVLKRAGAERVDVWTLARTP